MATDKKKESKQKYGDYNKDGKADSIGAMLRDITDGGGRGGSGASYSNLNNSDYRRAGGNPYQEGTKRSGWTSFDPQGKGRTEAQSPFMRNVAPSLFGLLTGGVSGAAMGMMGGALRNKVKDQGGLLNALGVGQNQASQQTVGLGSSQRPQIRPTNLALPQVALPYAAEDLAMSQEVLPYGPQPMPLSTMGQPPNNIMPATINPAGVAFQPQPIRQNADGSFSFVSGGLGTKPSAGVFTPMASSGNSAKMPPKGMSELAYTNWLRNNGGMLNVDKMTPDGLRAFYQNYRNIR